MFEGLLWESIEPRYWAGPRHSGPGIGDPCKILMLRELYLRTSRHGPTSRENCPEKSSSYADGSC